MHCLAWYCGRVENTKTKMIVTQDRANNSILRLRLHGCVFAVNAARIDLKTHPKVEAFTNATILGLCKWAKRECA